ncbi:RNA polymerase sigma factor [Fodinicola feengrottensis]|uniref:Sigma-70 family RNA polymerase sigma factor n=1 Tax=Fodinicola feengrottensis TaxID=435914 RepID=A0ABP4RS75_9ACTN|nr:sigma-70 family RNA polymerase sigma factor [Fodinicola feengrottensis]
MDPSRIERFTALYDTWHPNVHAYVVSRAGRQLADEAVNDTFMVAWRRLDDIPEPTLPWLLGVARNVVRQQFRATARDESLQAEMVTWAAVEHPANDIADGVTERAAVLRALASLPEADRELLTLVAWHGLSSRDAAKVVGCSQPTYFVRLHRARRRLETALADSAAEPAPALIPAFAKEIAR